MTLSRNGNRPHSPPYLIDNILPSNEIHLLAGPTGAGKTRWLFDTLMAWEKGLPVLGLASHPMPWIYVAGDRSIDAVYRTLDTMGISRAAFEILPAWDEKLTFNGIIELVQCSGAKLAVLEGFGQYVDPPGHTHQVRNFLRSACETIKMHDITVLGVVECPKMKPKDVYTNPRQRVSGAAAWGHHSETIFLVEPANPGDASDPTRNITGCPRNYAGIVKLARFDRNGKLVLCKESKNGNMLVMDR